MLMPAAPHVTPLIRDGILHDLKPAFSMDPALYPWRAKLPDCGVWHDGRTLGARPFTWRKMVLNSAMVSLPIIAVGMIWGAVAAF
jgi:hypothetical protein